MSELAGKSLVFFRHLPKTAGTSLTTTLANIYGDGQCHRFREVGEGFLELFSSVVQSRAKELSLVAGHIPRTLVRESASIFEFTILREPIARVLSLRRFLEELPASDRARLGLGSRVTVADLLASNVPEVYAQVRNGMARFFSSDRRFYDPQEEAFWEPPLDAQVVSNCLEGLKQITVGAVEDMQAALRVLQRRLRVPYELDVGRENCTLEHGNEVSLEDVRALIEANSVDLALFSMVMKHLPKALPPVDSAYSNSYDPRTLFDPQPGVEYSPAQIAGRQGFELYEEKEKLCWIGDSGRGRIHLAPSPLALTLTVGLYGIAPNYPINEVTFQIDGERWSATQQSAPTSKRYTLAPIPPHAHWMELAIMQPYSVPVAAIIPGSLDRRRLGTALLNICCEAA
jgi:hypothetical protein